MLYVAIRTSTCRRGGLGSVTAAAPGAVESGDASVVKRGTRADGTWRYHNRMLTRSARVPVFLAIPLIAAACSSPPAPISVSDNIVTVENQTSRDWTQVLVTVNDHYRGGAARVAARGRLTAPLSQFQTAFGQRYDNARQSVFKIEVTATDSKGEPVKLEWGRKKPRT
jgi:hypothetical protein